MSHDRIMEILADALELLPSQRPAFLDRACGGDAELRAEVERLLAAETAAAFPTIAAKELLDSHSAAPAQVGPYRIVREIGRGGMGVVYLAEQTQPVQRQVAIKIIQFGMSSAAVLARFNAERQALAMMNHPGVAAMYDAGVTETGRPYFVMEYVDGLPITEFCDKNRLDTRARVELFIEVCEAVQHAHQKAIIHRDIKPSNVLVTVQDGKPVAKVIDFGIAKAIEQRLTEKTIFTEHGQLVGTPEYMSPEQASMGSVDIDTRSDVYSLGVLLYELLTGALPFDRKSLRESAFDEIRRIIREVDPPKPSTRLSSLGAIVDQIAAARSSDATSHRRVLRGELDWITMRALEKDRNRRYSAPAELAADLSRHLRNEAVNAGPPSRVYRAKKFVRRHRAPVAAAVLVGLSLVTGIITTTWQARVARHEREIAQQQRDLAKRRFNDVRKLAGSFIFDVDDAIQNEGPTKARQKLVETARQYLDALSRETNEPELLSELADAYKRIGYVQSYSGRSNLGDVEGAARSFRKAVESAEALVAAKPGDRAAQDLLAGCWFTLGVSNADRGDGVAARDCWSKAIAIYEQLAQSDAGDWMAQRNKAMVIHRMANQLVYEGRQTEALAALTASLESRKALDRKFPGHAMLGRDVRSAQSEVASFLNTQSRPQEALVHLDAAVAGARQALKDTPGNEVISRELALLMHRAAESNRHLGQFRESLELAAELVDLRRRQVRDDPGDHDAKISLSGALFTEGLALMLLGRLDEALASQKEALELRREALRRTPDRESAQRWVGDSLRRVSEVLRRLGRFDEALITAQEGADFTARRAAALPDDESAAGSHYVALGELSKIKLSLGRRDEAVEVLRPIFPATAPTTNRVEMRSGVNWLDFGQALLQSGANQEALANLKTAEELTGRFQSDNPAVWDAMRDHCLAQVALATALQRNGANEDASILLSKALKSVDEYAQRFPQGTTPDLLRLNALTAEYQFAKATGATERAAAAAAKAREVISRLKPSKEHVATVDFDSLGR